MKSKNADLNTKKSDSTDGMEWFVLRDENKFGPFSFHEILQMLQTKEIFEYDYVWNKAELESWKLVSEIPSFASEKIKGLRPAGQPQVEEVFFRRRHARAKYGASILIHNNKEVWRGQSLELSSGGAGLILNTDSIQNGDSLFLHFKAGDGVPPFNATCRIVSKKTINGSSVRYGVKFTNISVVIQTAIKKFTKGAA